ncbi:MAG TPA: DUF6263 family protein [Gemmataceae bacterium]|nr:DUF6263 family protein [Gemmataceae bacterium]
MSLRRLVGALVLIGGLAAPAPGQEVTLKWDFQKGKPFYQEMTTTTKQTMKVMGMDVTQNQTQSFTFGWTPQEQDKDKNWIIEQEIVAVKMDIEIAGQKIPYDSTKDTAGTTNPLADFFKALVGSKFKLTVTPDFKIKSIEGRKEFIDKLVKANPQMEPLLNTILSDEALKQMAGPAFDAVPSTALKKGQTWTSKSQLDMGPIGKYDSNYKYTYEGPEGKLQKIKVDTTLAYQPPSPTAQTGNLPFRIKSADLKSSGATGTLYFDNDKHRLDKSDQKMTLEGKLTIDIGGQSSDVELKQEQTTSVKTYDQNPVTPAKK